MGGVGGGVGGGRVMVLGWSGLWWVDGAGLEWVVVGSLY